MEAYMTSDAFKRLEKLAELEKRVLGNIIDAKDGNEGDFIPDSISRDLRMRGSCPVPKKVLDDTMEDGLDTTISQLHKNRAFFTPGEALYHALGVKDDDIYNGSINMTLHDILSKITNRAAVGATQPETPMELDDFDKPEHIKVIVRMRGMRPDLLEKSAKDYLGSTNIMDSYRLTYMTGREEKIGAKYLKTHKSIIEGLINDGVIIKVIKIMSSGMKTTVYDKTAASSAEDLLYIELLDGYLSSII